MAENQPMNINDQESAGLAIFYLCSKYPNLPFTAKQENLQWQNLGSSECLGVFTMQGAHYLKKYVSGSYEGLVPLRLIYKTSPTSNGGRKNADTFLSDLASWLETCTATFKDNHMTLDSIERTSPVFKSDADNSGYEQYACTLNVKYFYKK